MMRALIAVLILCVWSLSAAAQGATPPAGKPATEATKRANAAVLQQLDFGDKQDFEDAKRGLIARPETLTLRASDGRVVWDMEAYKAFIAEESRRDPSHARRVIVITARDSHENVNRAMALGVRGYLRKPFSGAVFADLIRDAIEDRSAPALMAGTRKAR